MVAVWFQAAGPLVPVNTTYSPVPVHTQYPTPSLSQPDCDNIYQPIPIPIDGIQQVPVKIDIPACFSTFIDSFLFCIV